MHVFLDYKTIKLHYTREGQGPALVLLHGLLENLEMWTPFVPELRKTHTVICMDLLGHGQTGCLGYIHSMEVMAEAVWTVLEALDIKEAKCIGHSMGGYVALALAAAQPQLLKDVLLMNSTFDADSEDKKRLRSKSVALAKTEYKNVVRLSFANLFAPESRTAFKAEYEHALAQALATSPQGYCAAQLGMAKRKDHLATFQTIEGKKIILIGKKDTLVDAVRITSRIKDTAIRCVEFSAGHMSHIENKSELSYLFKRFIE